MSDSKDIVQSPAASYAHASSAARSRSIYGLLLLWLVLLFIVAAACASGFLLDRKFSHAYLQLARRQHTAERAVTKLQTHLQQRQALDVQQAQWAEQLTDVQNRLQALEHRSRNFERGQDHWNATEIEQMLAAANEQLRFTGNVSLALFALQNAAAQLAADTSLPAQTARKAVERDIQALQTASYADLAAKLDALLSQSDTLPLTVEPHPPAARSTASAASAAERNLTDTPPWKRGWTQFSARVAQQWSQWVQVRRLDQDHALLLAPEHGLLLRENLKLRLLAARLALLARDQTTLQSDVHAALQVLRYFDAAAPETQAMRRTLADLQHMAAHVTALNIDASLQAVRQYKNRS